MSNELLGIAESELAASGAIATAREIAQQPRMLLQTHAQVAQLQARLDEFAGAVTGNPAARVILTGAGTSAYIGECLAPLLDRRLPARVDAVPTTDLVSSPLLHLDPEQPLLLVSFGRSGNSPESLAAVALAESLVREVRHLVVTCNPQGSLARISVRESLVLQLPEETHDASFAMTSSFTCMMYATLAALAGSAPLDARIESIADAMSQVVAAAPEQIPALAARGFSRVVYLGAGPFKGLAREACLKLGELSNGAVATCFDSPLGFRHGPNTFIDAGTLVLVFVSNDPHARRYDHDLVDELRQDACAARVIEIAAQPREGGPQDTLVVPGMADAADVDLLWPYAAIAQAYAFYASRALGLAPDNPNRQGTVNRVVQGVRIHPFPG